jgi:type I restriction enzyme S subunit
MGNIQEGYMDIGKLKYLPKDHDEFPELLLKEGDLLFNRTNSAELVGKCAVYGGVPDVCSYASYLMVRQ